MAKPAMTAREAIEQDDRYAGNSDAVVRFLDYYSARTIKFTIVDEDTAYGVAFAKADMTQPEVVFFDYGVGKTIQRGSSTSFRATRAQTNLVKANSTNGAGDMAIEQIGLQPVNILADYPDEVNVGTNFGVTDSDVTNALRGLGPIFDPSALVTPAQCSSPLMNAESVLWEALARITSVKLDFDGQRRELSPAAQVGQLGAASYMRSWGEAGGESAYDCPEGYRWARDGVSDSDFSLILRVEEPIVVPLTLPTLVAASTGYQRAPEALYVEVLATVRGPQYDVISYNQ